MYSNMWFRRTTYLDARGFESFGGGQPQLLSSAITTHVKTPMTQIQGSHKVGHSNSLWSITIHPLQKQSLATWGATSVASRSACNWACHLCKNWYRRIVMSRYQHNQWRCEWHGIEWPLDLASVSVVGVRCGCASSRIPTSDGHCALANQRHHRWVVALQTKLVRAAGRSRESRLGTQ
jgi:hypothetical protein